MRLKIAHTTTYRYEPPATGVIQILRMTPGSHDGQYVADWQIDVSTDSRLDVHQDAFGNVTHVLTHGALSDLTIHVEGLIETHDTGGVLRGTATACHNIASKGAAIPADSATVGMSGAIDARWAAATPTMRILPLRCKGSMPPAVPTAISMVPPMRSCIAGPLPL